MDLQTEVSCTLCHTVADGLTYRGTPLCERHWRATLSEARRQLLEAGRARGYPALPLRAWMTLAAGEYCWRKFATNASDDAVQIALERLAAG